MNKIWKPGIVAVLMTLAAVGGMPGSFAGELEGGSEASLSSSTFPVIGGPGATVLTPTGAYSVGVNGAQEPWNPRQKDYSATGVRSVAEADAMAKSGKVHTPNVRNYSWGKTATRYAYNPNNSRRVSMSKFFTKY